MRHTYLTRVFLPLLGALCLSVLPDQPGAQAFTPQKPCTVGSLPQRPGEMLAPGQSATIYFMDHTGTATLDASQSTYDAVAWFRAGYDTVPPNWASGVGGDIKQCQPNMGDAGGDTHADPPSVGDHCAVPVGHVLQWGYGP